MELPQNYVAAAAAKPAGNVTLTVENLPALESAPPKEFGGPGDKWSPEDLLTAAVADCFLLSFRAIAAASKFEWTDLQCSVTGKLDKVDRAIKFTDFNIVATLTIPAGADESRAQKLLEKSEGACFITNSLNCTAHLETHIRVQ